MAKRKAVKETEMIDEVNSAETEAQVDTGAPAESTEAATEAPKTDERYKFIKDPATGENVKRKDFILKCWTQDKMSRGDIAKKLTELSGKKVPYQIVFAATKGVAGGPAKAPETPAAA